MVNVATAFKDNVVYLGGMFAPNKLRTQVSLTFKMLAIEVLTAELPTPNGIRRVSLLATY